MFKKNWIKKLIIVDRCDLFFEEVENSLDHVSRCTNDKCMKSF